MSPPACPLSNVTPPHINSELHPSVGDKHPILIHTDTHLILSTQYTEEKVKDCNVAENFFGQANQVKNV